MKYELVRNTDGVLRPAYPSDMEKVKKLPLGKPILHKPVNVRSPGLHRAYFAFINLVYTNLPHEFDDRFPTQRSFRKNLEMIAGYYEWFINENGETQKIPKSIAYDKLDEEPFRELFQLVKEVVQKKYLPITNEDIRAEIHEFY